MAKRHYKVNEIIEIDWLDASTCQGWRTKEHLEKNARSCSCKSVGYFFQENKQDMVISRTIEQDSGDRNDTEAIPKGMIKRIRRIR